MNLVDSSGWLEYFSGSRRAHYFETAIENTEELVVPVICLYEVFKVVARQRDETAAINAISFMRHGEVITIDERVSLAASRLSLEHNLAMADALILSVALQESATIWTQDIDFKGLANVQYFAKR